MSRIYTKTGDTGETGLIDGSRVPKDHRRVVAYGDVDELNAVLGLAAARAALPLKSLIQGLQRDLFMLGAQLADPQAAIGERQAKAALSEGHVARLEAAIDERQRELPPLQAFILPGGSEVGAWLHFARTVCRRAERAIASLAREQALDPLILVYVNRLSDLLFVLARHANQQAGVPEERW